MNICSKPSLYRFGVARFESIMELRNELENLGRMKGANRDEKGLQKVLTSVT